MDTAEKGLQTREQRYARTILDQVQRVKKDRSKEDCDRYGSMGHKLPILIRTAGLVQALTFLQTRKDSIYQQLLNDLARAIGLADGEKLLDQSRNFSVPEYMRLTQQVLDALVWYKRFAEAVLEVDASTEARSNEGAAGTGGPT
jgi:CRISPR-associated protein Cmr5